MPTEVTASVMIGPVRADSIHGQPSHGTDRLFAPSHIMVLMEGHRAVWILQRCPNLSRPAMTLRIRPSSPDHLLASGVLGYVALTMPRLIRNAADLRDLAELDNRRGEVRIHPLDRATTRRVFAHCSEHTYGLVTVLPGSSIAEGELQIAADAGMRTALSEPVHGIPMLP